MKEINLGRILMENRRRRGITQDELAEYLGVSKAAVSKWETETTYPDIAMLPKLAAYFDLTIDELMGYEPQMDREEIQRQRDNLAREFSTLPFREAKEHCLEMARKYYSCYPFLFRAASLLVNHAMLAPTKEETCQVYEEAKSLFLRIRQNAGDLYLEKEALYMEAYCLLAQNRPKEALALLKPEELLSDPVEPLLAMAYRMDGDTAQARQVLQTGIYRELLALFNLLAMYLDLCQDNSEAFEATVSRIQSLSHAFSMERLHPAVMLSCYLAIAQGWAAADNTEQAYRALEQYVELVTSDMYPLSLHGDSYFYLIDGWLEELANLDKYPPREEAVIRRSMTQALEENPAFAGLSGEARFQNLVRRLKENEKKNRENS